MDQSAERRENDVDLVSALEVIEAQPLQTRAASYAALHDGLVHALDAGPGAAHP